jgi:hypothetical protein
MPNTMNIQSSFTVFIVSLLTSALAAEHPQEWGGLFNVHGAEKLHIFEDTLRSSPAKSECAGESFALCNSCFWFCVLDVNMYTWPCVEILLSPCYAVNDSESSSFMNFQKIKMDHPICRSAVLMAWARDLALHQSLRGKQVNASVPHFAQIFFLNNCGLTCMFFIFSESCGADMSFASAYGMGQGSVDAGTAPKKPDTSRAQFSPRDVSDMYASAALHAADSSPILPGMLPSPVSHNCFYYTSKPECAIPDDNTSQVICDGCLGL